MIPRAPQKEIILQVKGAQAVQSLRLAPFINGKHTTTYMFLKCTHSAPFWKKMFVRGGLKKATTFI